MILSLDNQDIENAKQLADISKDLPVNKAIPVLVQRNGGAQFLAIKIEKGGEDD
jgi:serine protease Do